MKVINRESSRGRGNFGWLKANYSFSFSSYYNAQKMGFKSLRVINEDFIAPKAGFPFHSHQNMEILTIVLSGNLTHKDSLGNVAHLYPGRIQRMYAGHGITHSEYNESDEELNLLQIWIEPNQINLKPEYEEKEFIQSEGFQLLASPGGREGSIRIHQNLEVGIITLKPEEEIVFNLKSEAFYFHIIKGKIAIGKDTLTYGDSLQGEQESIKMQAQELSQILMFKFL